MTKRPIKKRSIKKPSAGGPKRVTVSPRQSGALASTGDVGPLVERVVAILQEARARVVRTVNSTMVLAYWHVGREIVEFVQRGAKRAEYGEQVLDVLSAHLRARIGRGYSTTNLRYFRTFYLAFRDRVPEIRHIGGGESRRQAQGTVGRLAQKARAAGIHLVVCMQRPDANALKGAIKANILHRFALKLPQNTDSRIILDDGGAETLLGQGDLLYKDANSKLQRLQVPYLDNATIKLTLAEINARSTASEPSR